MQRLQQMSKCDQRGGRKSRAALQRYTHSAVPTATKALTGPTDAWLAVVGSDLLAVHLHRGRSNEESDRFGHNTECSHTFPHTVAVDRVEAKIRGSDIPGWREIRQSAWQD